MSRSSHDLPAQLLRRAGSSVGEARELPIGVLDLFKIGIGPSSSHTIGPMKAAGAFVSAMGPATAEQIARISVAVFGSLAWTGKGHATDKALVLGLSGELPDRVDPDEANRRFEHIQAHQRIELPCGRKDPVRARQRCCFR